MTRGSIVTRGLISPHDVVAQLLEWPGRRGKVLLVRTRTKTTEPLPAHDGSFHPPSPKRPIPAIRISSFSASAFSSNSVSESFTLGSSRIPKCLLLPAFSCCLVLSSSGIELYNLQGSLVLVSPAFCSRCLQLFVYFVAPSMRVMSSPLCCFKSKPGRRVSGQSGCQLPQDVVG